MITLKDIADRLDSKCDYKFTGRKYDWRPVIVDNYVLPDFRIIESNAKGANAKLRKKFSKVLTFVESVKHVRAKTGCTIMPISVKSKSNLLIWGSEKNITNAVSFMKEIGLISTENEHYQFNAFYEKDNSSKTFRYYVENEEKVKQYCSEHNIEAYQSQNIVYTVNSDYQLHHSIDKSKVRFSSNVKLIKPIDLSKADFEKMLTLCLYENYPGLRFHIEKANEINDKYYRDYPEFRIRFQPNFTWSSDGTYIKGIGIRATNSMTNVKKEQRKEILQAYGFILEKDINASVPRMTLSLNSGHWIDESQDIYELIFREMAPNQEFTNEMREAIKKLHMRAYFDSSDRQVGHHTWLAMNQEGINKNDVCDEMSKLREAIIISEGGHLYGNEIFYVESCVYLMTLYDLLSSYHRVWQIYDCFYSTGNETQEEFEYMISEGVRLNFEEFFRMWHYPF